MRNVHKILEYDYDNKPWKGDKIIHSTWMTNDLAASVVGILVTVILQSNNTVVAILISMVGGNLVTLRQANFITLGSQIGITFINAYYSLSLRKRDEHFEVYYAVGIMNDVTNLLCYVVILPAEIYASPIESMSEYILERWKNTCPTLTTLTYITQSFVDLIIEIDRNLVLPVNDSYVLEPPRNFIIQRCVDPDTTATIFCPYRHLFRYSFLGDRSIVIIIATFTLISLIIAQMMIVFLIHSLCDGLFSEKFMIFVNKIACLKFIWLFDWMIDAVMIAIGFVLFPIIEPHDLFSPRRNPYAKLNPSKVHRLYPMLLGANIGSTMGGVAAAFAVPAATLYNALRIALDQFCYNVFCLVLFYPLPVVRRIPIKLSLKFGQKTAKYRWFAFIYVGIVSAIILSVTLFTSFFPDTATYIYIIIASTAILSILIITLFQRLSPQWLPDILKTWDWLPLWMRSLRPYHHCLRDLCPCRHWFNHVQV